MDAERKKLISVEENESAILAFVIFPFLFIARWRSFLLSHLALSGYLLYMMANAAVMFNDFGVSRFRYYRLLNEHNLNGTVDIITNFTLLRRGCNVPIPTVGGQGCGVDIEDGWSCFLSTANQSAHSKEIDGFRLAINHSNAAVAPVPLRFRLQGSLLGDKDWTDVGTPRFRRVREGIRLLGGELSLGALPAPSHIDFDFQVPWPLVVREGCVPGVEGALLACLVACAAAGRPEWSRRAFHALLAAGGLMHSVAGAGFLALGQWREAAYPLCMAGAFCGFLGLLWRWPRLLRYGLAGHGGFALLLRAVEECALFADCGRYPAAAAGDALPAAWTLAGLLIIALCSRASKRAAAAAAADRAALDASWSRLVSVPARRRQLQDLAALTDRLQRGMPSAAARHLDRRPAAAAGGGRRAGAGEQRPVEPFRQGEPGTRDTSRTVRSLARLYSQALLVAPLLQARAAAWAAEAGAAVHCVRGGGGEGRTRGDWGLEEWIRAGGVKSPRRAAEKALVLFDGDVSRVVDVCRVRLIVTDLRQAAAAVEAVVGDGGARVVRVWNSMRLDTPGSAGGWRVRATPFKFAVHSLALKLAMIGSHSEYIFSVPTFLLPQYIDMYQHICVTLLSCPVHVYCSWIWFLSFFAAVASKSCSYFSDSFSC